MAQMGPNRTSHTTVISPHARVAMRTPQVLAPVATQDTTCRAGRAIIAHQIAEHAHPPIHAPAVILVTSSPITTV